MLDRLTQRVKSRFISEKEARERLDDLRIELGRGVEFQITRVDEDGGYYLAKSVNSSHGLIITSAEREEDLENKIKDAIFTAFEVPSQYCNPEDIEKVGEVKKVRYAAR